MEITRAVALLLPIRLICGDVKGESFQLDSRSFCGSLPLDFPLDIRENSLEAREVSFVSVGSGGEAAPLGTDGLPPPPRCQRDGARSTVATGPASVASSGDGPLAGGPHGISRRYEKTGLAKVARTAADAVSTSAWSELPWASMVTIAGKSVTRSRHIASGMPNSRRCTSSTSSMQAA